jgi:DNA-directed RNA polymerase subunit K/omega
MNKKIDTTVVDKMKLEKYGKSIYSIINLLGIRANQIHEEFKFQLNKRLNQFSSLEDDFLEEIFERKEKIEVSKFFESLPKPTTFALKEFFEGEIDFFFKKKSH